MPRVSIILCSYNQAAFVQSTVESVLAQTFSDWELIALDNGSTDGSQEVLRAFEDPRIRLVLDSENIAITRRFNQGVALARSEYVSFLYSDDLYAPHKLELQVAALDGEARDCDVAYGRVEGWNVLTDARWVHPTLEASGDILVPFLEAIGVRPIDMQTPLVRRRCWERFPFHEDIFAEGEIALAKLATVYRFHFLDHVLVTMRDHGSNRGKALRKNLEMTLEALRRLGEVPEFPARGRPALASAGPRLWGQVAWSLARLGGDPAYIQECVRHAVFDPGARRPDPRVAGALALSLLPPRLRRRVNDLGSRLRDRADNSRIVDGYGGSAS